MSSDDIWFKKYLLSGVILDRVSKVAPVLCAMPTSLDTHTIIRRTEHPAHALGLFVYALASMSLRETNITQDIRQE